MNKRDPVVMPETKPQLGLTFSTDGGGGTWLSHRHVRFPYSVGAPFALDGHRTDIQTVILQSASGGLYGGETLASAIAVQSKACARIVTPAAASVYSARGGMGTAQRVMLKVEQHGRLAFLPRANILFPGARLGQGIHADVADTGRLLLRDGFATHRPAGVAGAFEQLEVDLDIRASGIRLLAERSRISGGMVENGAAGVAGHFRAFGSVILIAPDEAGLVEGIFAAHAADIHSRPGCYCGMSRLRGNTGLVIRIAATDGGALEQETDAIIERIEPKFFS